MRRRRHGQGAGGGRRAQGDCCGRQPRCAHGRGRRQPGRYRVPPRRAPDRIPRAGRRGRRRRRRSDLGGRGRPPSGGSAGGDLGLVGAAGRRWAAGARRRRPVRATPAVGRRGRRVRVGGAAAGGASGVVRGHAREPARLDTDALRLAGGPAAGRSGGGDHPLDGHGTPDTARAPPIVQPRSTGSPGGCSAPPTRERCGPTMQLPGGSCSIRRTRRGWAAGQTCSR